MVLRHEQHGIARVTIRRNGGAPLGVAHTEHLDFMLMNDGRGAVSNRIGREAHALPREPALGESRTAGPLLRKVAELIERAASESEHVRRRREKRGVQKTLKTIGIVSGRRRRLCKNGYRPQEQESKEWFETAHGSADRTAERLQSCVVRGRRPASPAQPLPIRRVSAGSDQGESVPG